MSHTFYFYQSWDNTNTSKHYTMVHQKLFIREYFTYEHEEICGSLGAIVFTANINDCLRPVPMGILPVLCES